MVKWGGKAGVRTLYVEVIYVEKEVKKPEFGCKIATF
jgi:hypothetical protein